MDSMPLPIRIIAPGRVYRKDEVDATHSPMFHQVEGMVIDKGVTMADLKGTLNTVVEKLYGKGTKTRFRPHHFPFTEPSCEMDVQCHKCGGVGCPTCKGEGWIELLGAGMIHPRVLEMAGIDPEVYSGWAFGIGLERTAMPVSYTHLDVYKRQAGKVLAEKGEIYVAQGKKYGEELQQKLQEDARRRQDERFDQQVSALDAEQRDALRRRLAELDELEREAREAAAQADEAQEGAQITEIHGGPQDRGDQE